MNPINEMVKHLLDQVDDYATTPEDLEQAEHVLAAHLEDTTPRLILGAMVLEIRVSGRLSPSLYKEALCVAGVRGA